MIDSPFSEHIAFAEKSAGEEAGFSLFPEELAILSPNAVEKRRREFFLGRAAAHAAIGSLLGASLAPVLKGKQGEPIWPAGLVGSIAHSSDIAVAAVGKKHHFPGIGLDVESRERSVSLNISRHLCTPGEQEWVMESGGEAHEKLKMLFSAKEAIFKAFYPIEDVFLSYKDAELSWDNARGGFAGQLRKQAGHAFPSGYTMRVGCRLLEKYIFSYICLPAETTIVGGI